MGPRVLIPILVAVTLATIGVLVMQVGGASAPDQPPAPTATTAPPPPSPEAARSLALEWVASSGDVMQMGPIERRMWLEPLVTPELLDDMVASLNTDLQLAAAELRYPPGELVVRETPLAAMVTAGDNEAHAKVWTVVVFGAEPLGSPRCLWRTVELTLQVHDHRWKVTSVDDQEGPAPISVDTLPASWDEFAVVASWQEAGVR